MRLLDSLHMTDLIAEGSRVYVFGEERVFRPRYIASVLRITRDVLELQLDPDDLGEARIAEGQRVLLGFAVATRNMRFGASVSALAIQPRGRLVLSAPKSVEKWPQRGYVRAPLSVPCELVLSGRDGSRIYEVKGMTSDISASGARVHVTPRVPESELHSARGTLRLEFPEREPIVTPCRVVRQLASAGEESEGSSFAVEYQDIREQDEMQIQLLVLRATGRRFLRVEASVPCRVEIPTNEGRPSRYSGVSENVSAGGLLIGFGEHVPLRARDRVAVELTLPNRYLAVADAEVVRVEHGEDRTRIAVDFGTLEELDHQSLIRFVVAQLRGLADAAPFDAAPAADRGPISRED